MPEGTTAAATPTAPAVSATTTAVERTASTVAMTTSPYTTSLTSGPGVERCPTGAAAAAAAATVLPARPNGFTMWLETGQQRQLGLTTVEMVDAPR